MTAFSEVHGNPAFPIAIVTPDRTAPCSCGHPRWLHSKGDYLHSIDGDDPLTDGPCGGMNKSDTATCPCRGFSPPERKRD